VKVTAIKQQVKRTTRYSIYVDGKYALSLSEGELLRSGLHVGQELDEIELSNLEDKSVLDKAYMRALDLISRRARSEWEIKDRLQKKNYDEAVQQATIDRLRSNRLLNDLEFARQWVQSRRKIKLTSRRRLVNELRQKRVPDDVISVVFQEDESDDKQTLRELIEIKRRQSKYREDNLKLMQYLSRQGYSYYDIRSVLSEEK
jgi:regulatory protein